MHEVDVLALTTSSQQLTVTAGTQFERIPAHVRDLDARRTEQLLDRTFEPAEALKARGFFTRFEQDLHAQADPEVGRARAQALEQHLEQLWAERLQEAVE